MVIAGDTSGTITLAAPAVSGTTTLTLPATTDTLVGKTTTDTLTNKTLTSPTITGASITVASTAAPAFSAYLASNTSFSTSTWSKIPCATEEFDTNSNYDNTTNYRFTPTIAGYYQINGRFDALVNSTISVITVYKNGVEFKRGVDLRATLTASSGVTVSSLIYMNGTTDYLELYAFVVGTSPQYEGGAATTYFQGFLARSA